MSDAAAAPPGAARPLDVCLSFDFDAISLWGAIGQTSPTPVSRGEFGARVAVPRLLALLAEAEVQATFFVPGHTIDTYPELCRRILAEGHEIGHHGYLHEGPVALSEGEERAVLERGLESMERQLDGYRPAGYRSPAWDLSANTTRLLVEYGFEYESSMMAQDFEPYWCRTGDRMPPDRGFEFGPEIALVELPVSWSLDDFVELEYVYAPPLVLPAAKNPREVEARWLADMDFAAEAVPGGVFTMTFHPQVIGRGARIRIVAAMIAHAVALGANLVTTAAAARAWAERAPGPIGSRLQR
ncbi:MAG: polysaccharide deacetylase [Actinobacteria bacterium]|nr:polysaccharide deacetylase [Actinomycetota bacterium]